MKRVSNCYPKSQFEIRQQLYIYVVIRKCHELSTSNEKLLNVVDYCILEPKTARLMKNGILTLLFEISDSAFLLICVCEFVQNSLFRCFPVPTKFRKKFVKENDGLTPNHTKKTND